MSNETDIRWQKIQSAILACQKSKYALDDLNGLNDMLYSEDFGSMGPDLPFLQRLVMEYGHDVNLIALWGSVLSGNLHTGAKRKREKIYPLVLQLIENWHKAEDKKTVFPVEFGMLGLMSALHDSVRYGLPDDVFKRHPNVYEFVVHSLKTPLSDTGDQGLPRLTQQVAVVFLKSIQNTQKIKDLTDQQAHSLIAILSAIDPVRAGCRQEDLDLIRESLNQKILNGKKG